MHCKAKHFVDEYWPSIVADNGPTMVRVRGLDCNGTSKFLFPLSFKNRIIVTFGTHLCDKDSADCSVKVELVFPCKN